MGRTHAIVVLLLIVALGTAPWVHACHALERAAGSAGDDAATHLGDVRGEAQGTAEEGRHDGHGPPEPESSLHGTACAYHQGASPSAHGDPPYTASHSDQHAPTDCHHAAATDASTASGCSDDGELSSGGCSHCNACCAAAISDLSATASSMALPTDHGAYPDLPPHLRQEPDPPRPYLG
ncbi:hypothetical protein [Halorhodospira abdelmalekii]|uniref:hypothetical protein n=1 Tax=Halorhodospira abdelmalekii TaxID=421629 RepID=UPI001908F3D0|nr:hypothetical protein [Halorhodospira abdelmalekii]